jgi:hypothetical protein
VNVFFLFQAKLAMHQLTASSAITNTAVTTTSHVASVTDKVVKLVHHTYSLSIHINEVKLKSVVMQVHVGWLSIQKDLDLLNSWSQDIQIRCGPVGIQTNMGEKSTV